MATRHEVHDDAVSVSAYKACEEAEEGWQRMKTLPELTRPQYSVPCAAHEHPGIEQADLVGLFKAIPEGDGPAQ
ncbi:hypothetical protein [Kushneria avicenniae]|uniref:hypothetical protein n=1 Tax=Kushneria avicenniae TaxID=402385 RepID=UPI000B7CEA68|nr:hypothetical protein [Kushneria avicenniae]